MISWGHMTEAYFPVSGLPSAVSLSGQLSLWASGPLASGDLHHILREQIHAAEGRRESAHGFLVGQGDGLAGSNADIFLEVGDERDESDAVQRGGFAEEPGLRVGLFQGGLAELTAERGEATEHEG